MPCWLGRDAAGRSNCRPYDTEEVKFISIRGAAHLFLAGIRANPKSANVAVRAPTGMTPLRRDMYRFPRWKGCNSWAGRGPPWQPCESSSAILNLSLAVFRWILGPLRKAFSADVPHKKCSFCRNPGGGPPNFVAVGLEKGVEAQLTCKLFPDFPCGDRTFGSTRRDFAGLLSKQCWDHGRSYLLAGRPNLR
jgi:hypothetical protein